MELSLEEKKAIEYIKEFRNEVFEGIGNKSIMAKNIDILLKLVDKQQKEIEKYNKVFENVEETTLYADGKEIHKLIELTDFISKDKIRKKIKELDNITYAECIERAEEDIKLLKELLGE